MSALKELIDRVEVSLDLLLAQDARAELAALCAERDRLAKQLATDYSQRDDEPSYLDALSLVLEWHKAPGDISFEAWICTRVKAQARQLEAARKLLTDLDWNDWDERVDAWLAANAPAPQAEQEQTA